MNLEYEALWKRMSVPREKRPPIRPDWSEAREIMGGEWFTCRELARRMGRHQAAATMWIKKNRDLFERRVVSGKRVTEDRAERRFR